MLPELAEIGAVGVQHLGELVIDRVDVVVEVEVREIDRARRVAEARAEHPVEQAVERRLGKLLLERQAEREHVVGLVAAFGARIDDLPVHRVDRAGVVFLDRRDLVGRQACRGHLAAGAQQRLGIEMTVARIGQELVGAGAAVLADALRRARPG